MQWCFDLFRKEECRDLHLYQSQLFELIQDYLHLKLPYVAEVLTSIVFLPDYFRVIPKGRVNYI